MEHGKQICINVKVNTVTATAIRFLLLEEAAAQLKQ